MFKSGDRVRNKRGTTFSNGAFVNTVEKIAEGGMVWILETGTWVGVESIEHESPTASPVRTVTRREIVPGRYGRISINNGADGVTVAVGLHLKSGERSSYANLSATELREAAHLFNQLAEALEGKP